MLRLFRVLALILLVAAAPAEDNPYAALRAVDARLAGIAYRLVTANAALCRERQPATGLVLHAQDQYPRDAAVTAAFGFPAPVAVELVVPGSPAAAAGIVANEGVAAIDGKPVTAPGSAINTSVTRDAALAQLAAAPADRPLTLAIVGADGARRDVTLPAHPGCRGDFEILATQKLGASSDGRVVQVGARLMAKFDRDEDIAVVVGHELSHTILRHRARLEAAGVRWGLLAQFGRNARLFRETESEADALGAILIRNAGWDAQEAVRFWRTQGSKIDGGMFHSRTHPGSGDRARAIETVLATVPADAPVPYVPPMLAQRDAALD